MKQVETRLYDALHALKRSDVAPWVDMFAENGIREFPYAPPNCPTMLGGRQAIADYMRSYPDHIAVHEVQPDRVHRCEDTLVVEFALEITIVPTGRELHMRYVGVIELEAGKIKRYRDYWNPLLAMQAMGEPDAVLALGTKEPAR